MAYEYFITRISDFELENPQRLKIPDWVNDPLSKEGFKSIIRYGELDKFAIFTKDEILEKAKKYEEARKGSALNHMVEPNSSHAKAIEHIEGHEDAIYLLSAIFWESGLT